MFRCMTCDGKKRGEPVMLPLDDSKPKGEAVGVCAKCAVVIRSFNTLAALSAGEYEERGACKSRCLCDECVPVVGSA